MDGKSALRQVGSSAISSVLSHFAHGALPVDITVAHYASSKREAARRNEPRQATGIAPDSPSLPRCQASPVIAGTDKARRRVRITRHCFIGPYCRILLQWTKSALPYGGSVVTLRYRSAEPGQADARTTKFRSAKPLAWWPR